MIKIWEKLESKLSYHFPNSWWVRGGILLNTCHLKKLWRGQEDQRKPRTSELFNSKTLKQFNPGVWLTCEDPVKYRSRVLHCPGKQWLLTQDCKSGPGGSGAGAQVQRVHTHVHTARHCHCEGPYTHRGYGLDVKRNLPQYGQNFRTMSGNRVPKRKMWSETPILHTRRSQFFSEGIIWCWEFLFVIVGKNIW